MTHTDLLYQRESYKQQHTATVLSCQATDGDKHWVICDQTIFYPQGGGQPTDIGSIEDERGERRMDVAFVSYDRQTGYVKHEGCIISRNDIPSFEQGDRVQMEIDWPTRYHHMRLHSGGHLIDHAVQVLECPFKALKASHFPSGPAVEFSVLPEGNFATDRAALDAFTQRLQAICDELLARDMAILVFEEDDSEEAGSIAQTHSEKAEAVREAATKVRMVLFEGCPAAVPCGGTHVARAGEIGRVIIKKITFKSQVLRISYLISQS